jgi:hypothetical protein
MGLEVAGSIGVLIKAVKAGINSKEEPLDDLKKLAKVMWLSVGVSQIPFSSAPGFPFSGPLFKSSLVSTPPFFFYFWTETRCQLIKF